MKPKTYLKVILILLGLTCSISCKKDAGTNTSSPIIVKYEVTWTSALYQTVSNQIIYVNSTDNGEIDNNISGTSWTKTVTIQNPNKFMVISVATLIPLQ
jgi:hypothetical protein